MHWKYHKINFKRGGLYINSPKTTNSNKNDNNCFQYAATASLNYEKVGKNIERIIKNKLFRSEYNWEGIKYPSKKDD